MDNFTELKKALASQLAEKGDYSSAILLTEEEKKKEKREKVKIVSKGGTNTNVVKKMIDTALAGIGAGVSDHGALTGLADDDHTQYHNNTRGDARYFTQSQVTTSLSGKADTIHTHVKADITDFSDADYADAIHTHAISDTTGLQTALDGKADDAHTHIIADTTGLQAAIDGKAATSHAHIIADVTGLQTALDGKTATGHTHSIGDVSGLGAELAAKLETVLASDVDSGVSTDGYVLTSDGAGNAAWEASVSGVTDHGALTGLADDDHTQYHNDTRGDARYSLLSHNHTGVYEPAKGADDNFVTDAEKVKLSNLSGTNTGDQTSIVGITGAKAQFDTAVTDGNFMYVGDAPTTHTHTAADITDFDTEVANNSAVALNTAKVTNATHTGDATGATALTVVKIQGKDFPTLSAGDDQKYPKYDNGTNAFVMTAIAGGGNVSNTGTPVNNQIAVWTNSTTVEGDANLTFDTTTDLLTTGAITLAAGTATLAPIKLTAGTNLTTAEDGAIEMDADCFYGCTDAGNRGVIPVEHIIRADATRTFTSNTSQQAIFTTPASGTLTLETGTYLFEGLIAMTSMSATSGNGKFSLIGAGTATLGSILWQAYGNDNASQTTGAAIGGMWSVIATQTATNIVTAGTGTAMAFLVKGTFEVTGAGTIIPSFAQTTAAAAVVSIGSYIKFNRIGSTTMTSVGQWT